MSFRTNLFNPVSCCLHNQCGTNIAPCFLFNQAHQFMQIGLEDPHFNWRWHIPTNSALTPWSTISFTSCKVGYRLISFPSFMGQLGQLLYFKGTLIFLPSWVSLWQDKRHIPTNSNLGHIGSSPNNLFCIFSKMNYGTVCFASFMSCLHDY